MTSYKHIINKLINYFIANSNDEQMSIYMYTLYHWLFVYHNTGG